MVARRSNGCLLRALLCAALSCAVVYAAGAGVADASGWEVQALPSPSLSNGWLSMVSCASRSTCVAGGGYAYDTSAHGEAPLVERWDGKTWSIQDVPTPADSKSAVINSVSCASSQECVAVGEQWRVGPVDEPLAVRWDGSRWSAQRFPVPSSNFISVNGVSCSSARRCIAVGFDDVQRGYNEVSDLLMERWNGRSWSRQAIRGPAGVPSSYLTAVSCRSDRACVAVGATTTDTADVGGGNGMLVVRWNGIRWSTKRLAGPPNHLSSVSCAAANACTAVGGWRAVRWNGHRWLVESIPHPARAKGAGMTGVSCSSRVRCVAVGTVRGRSGHAVGVVGRWNGAKWSVRQFPNAVGARASKLVGVSCIARMDCIAVGSRIKGGGSLTLAERTTKNPRSMQPQRTPDPIGYADTGLAGVSCTSPTACTALGTLDCCLDRLSQLTEAWDGTTWTFHRTPSPPEAEHFDALSCARANVCVAVGGAGISPPYTTLLAETWNGTTWAVQRASEPPGTTQSALSAVSCASATACTAVGYSINSRTGLSEPLAETWNGTEWTIQGSATPLGGGRFNAVSCTSTTACTAVGYIGGGTRTLAETWNGTSWTIQPTLSPDKYANVLTGVSCTSTTACSAVGSFGQQQLMAERWDGSSWTVQSLPNPSAPYRTLSAISCASATACTAVGWDGLGGNYKDVPLAEAWDGARWSIQSTPNPSGASNASLTSVSCTSATTCVAVGSYTPGGYASRALVEHS
jgi:hypothetical protein